MKNRRTILKTAGSAALLTAARAVVPGGAWAAAADAPETTTATFEDGAICQEILDAAELSAQTGRWQGVPVD